VRSPPDVSLVERHQLSLSAAAAAGRAEVGRVRTVVAHTPLDHAALDRNHSDPSRKVSGKDTLLGTLQGNPAALGIDSLQAWGGYRPHGIPPGRTRGTGPGAGRTGAAWAQWGTGCQSDGSRWEPGRRRGCCL
jgi:hypothetical protein